MNRFVSFLLIVIVSVISAYLTVRISGDSTISHAEKETAFERVTRTNTLRCGYYTQAPIMWKEAETGKMDGWGARLTEDLGKLLNIKIEWAEEVTFGNMFAGLEAGRYDAICPGVWISATRGRVAEFGRDFLYSAVGIVTRKDDKRFDDIIDRINDPNVTISIMDGDITDAIAKADFPKAKVFAIPNNTDYSQVFVNVTTRKADVTFGERATVNLFIKENPGKVKLSALDYPMRIFPWTVTVRKGEHDLISFLNAGMTELIYSGAVERHVKAYQAAPDNYIFVPRF